jgi:S1-C subfamily serine protease
MRIRFGTGVVVAAVLIAGSAVAFGEARAGQATSAGDPSAGVVVVSTSAGYGERVGAGTGIVLSSSGEVLTNNHVIRGATAIRVTDVSTGRTYPATVAGYSVTRDIALLRLRNAHGLRTATIGSSSGLRLGSRVIAVGNAGGTGALSRASGRITGLGRTITVGDDTGATNRLSGLIETNARLQPGDSGGPLLSNAHVIGVDAAASSSFQFRGSGRGFAIPIDTAIAIAHQIKGGQRSSTVHVGPTAFLGVALGSSGSDGRGAPGAVVEAVVSGSPADKAGLEPADLITTFGGQRVSSAKSLQSFVLRVSPGAVRRLTWVDRYGYASSATVRLVTGAPQ